MTGTQQQNWWLQCLLLFFHPAWEAPVTSQVCLFVSFVCLLHLCVCLANMRGTSDKSGDTELTQLRRCCIKWKTCLRYWYDCGEVLVCHGGAWERGGRKNLNNICKVGNSVSSVERSHVFYYRTNQVKEGLDQLVRVGEMKQKKK